MTTRNGSKITFDFTNDRERQEVIDFLNRHCLLTPPTPNLPVGSIRLHYFSHKKVQTVALPVLVKVGLGYEWQVDVCDYSADSRIAYGPKHTTNTEYLRRDGNPTPQGWEGLDS